MEGSADGFDGSTVSTSGCEEDEGPGRASLTAVRSFTENKQLVTAEQKLDESQQRARKSHAK